ncbi:MAG: hypothetical protein QM564_11605 [Bergeyella sp.]
MDKNTATKYDALLSVLCKSPNSSWHISHIAKEAEKVGFLTSNELQTAISVFMEDDFLDFIRHPNAPEHNFQIYTITNKGIKFISHEGGYSVNLDESF